MKATVIPREFGVEYHPWDRVDWDDAIGSDSNVLGPGQSEGFQITAIPIGEIRAIAQSEKGYDFAVWIEYEDTVTDPPIKRQTRLCQRINGDLDGGVSFSSLPRYNCADGDCPK